MKDLNKNQKIGVISLIIAISGIFGWIYEFIFYYFNGGMKEFYMQGGNFLPWINIYAIGAILILIFTKKMHDNPVLVFISSILITGLLEYFSGLAIYKLLGARYWDYNTEILNFGNIGGFICLRSVLFFGLSSLILVYIILPMCINIAKKMKTKTFLIISLALVSIILFDEIYNLVFTKIFNLPSATKIYESLGFKYVK